MEQTSVGTRMTRARFLALGAGALAPVALAACGAPPTPGTEPPAVARRPVTLVIDNDWSAGDRLTLVQGWLDHARTKYPHVSVELHDNAASHEKTHATFAADQQGDLFQLDQWLVPVYGPKGVLQDISAPVAAQRFDESSLYDIPDRTHWNGKRIGFLIQLNFSNWVYNKSAFQEAGVAEPAPTWTWEAYTDAARKVNRPPEDRWGTIVISNEIFRFFHMADVPYWDPPRREAFFDRPGARELLQWLTDLVVRYGAAPTPRELADKRPTFVNGGIVIHWQTFANPGITTNIAGRFQWELLPVPQHPRTKKQLAGMGGHPYLVTTKAQQRGVLNETVQVLLSLFDKEVQDLYASGLNLSSLPILKSVATGPQWVQGMPGNYKRYTLDWLNDKSKTLASPATIGRAEFGAAVAAELNKALAGEVSVEQAAANMTRAGTAALQQAAR
jgi:ABC-type glycerol-3-phosphate transport system substrate-binding protein